MTERRYLPLYDSTLGHFQLEANATERLKEPSQPFQIRFKIGRVDNNIVKGDETHHWIQYGQSNIHESPKRCRRIT